MDTIIYQEWDSEVIDKAIDDFRKVMYDGGSQQELTAGKLCFDFLTRKSKLTEAQRSIIDALCDEADMRIALMNKYDDLQRSEEEQRQRVIQALRYFSSSVKSLLKKVDRYQTDYYEREMDRYHAN